MSNHRTNKKTNRTKKTNKTKKNKKNKKTKRNKRNYNKKILFGGALQVPAPTSSVTLQEVVTIFIGLVDMTRQIASAVLNKNHEPAPEYTDAIGGSQGDKLIVWDKLAHDSEWWLIKNENTKLVGYMAKSLISEIKPVDPGNSEEFKRDIVILLRYYMKYFYGIDIPQDFTFTEESLRAAWNIVSGADGWEGRQSPLPRHIRVPISPYHICILLFLQCLYFIEKYDEMSESFLSMKKQAEESEELPVESEELPVERVWSGYKYTDFQFPSYWIDSSGALQETEQIALMTEQLSFQDIQEKISKQQYLLQLVEANPTQRETDPSLKKSFYEYLIEESGVDFGTEDDFGKLFCL